MKKLLFLFLIIAVVSCKKNEEVVPTDNSKFTDITFSSNTKVVTQESNKNLVKIEPSKLTFKTGTGLEKVSEGDILMSGITLEAPSGYLRKVVSVTNSGDNITVITKDATIEEAIKECHIKTVKPISLRIGANEIPNGRLNSTSEFQYPYKYEYDRDNDKNTPNDKIVIEGTLKINPEFKFELDIEEFTVKNLVTSLKVTNMGEVKVTIGGKVGKISDLIKNADGILIAEIPLPPLNIPGTPIVFTQSMSLVFGIEGEVSGKVEVSISAESNVEAGIKYTKEKGIDFISYSEDKLNEPKISVEGIAKFEPWVGIRYKATPFGMPDFNIYIALRVSEKAEVSFKSQNVGLGVSTVLGIGFQTGVKFYAKANFQIFGKALLKVEQTFYDKYFDSPWYFTYDTNKPIALEISKIVQMSGFCDGFDIDTKFDFKSNNIVEYGIAYSETTQQPTIEISKKLQAERIYSNSTNDGLGFSVRNGTFKENTKYYFKLYAKNNAGIVWYSTTKDYTMPKFSAVNPVIQISKISNVSNNGFTVEAKVLSGCIFTKISILSCEEDPSQGKTCLNVSGSCRPDPIGTVSDTKLIYYAGGEIDIEVARQLKSGKRYNINMWLCNSAGTFMSTSTYITIP